jgi:hypothetical protein
VFIGALASKYVKMFFNTRWIFYGNNIFWMHFKDHNILYIAICIKGAHVPSFAPGPKNLRTGPDFMAFVCE